MGGQLSLRISLARSKAVDDLTDAVVAALLAVKRSDAALFDHLDTSFVNVHLTVCKKEEEKKKKRQTETNEHEARKFRQAVVQTLRICGLLVHWYP